MSSASSLLMTEEHCHLEALLRWNVDIFVWTHLDILEIDPPMATHKLNILPSMHLVREKFWSFHPNSQKVIQKKINKLLAAGFIWEVTYPDWLAKVVVVPKKGRIWRVCMDYTNLNNVCPNDSFLLSWIDHIIDSTSGNGILYFLDVFSYYHQILMFSPDKEKWLSSHLMNYTVIMSSLLGSKMQVQHIRGWWQKFPNHW